MNALEILEWQRRAAKRLIDKAKLSKAQAIDCAITLYEEFVSNGHEVSETPEECVDDELSYWDEPE